MQLCSLMIVIEYLKQLYFDLLQILSIKYIIGNDLSYQTTTDIIADILYSRRLILLSFIILSQFISKKKEH